MAQADKTGDAPLSDLVKEYIKIRYNKPGDVFLGTVHRIDRPVSGVIVYARTSKALSRLTEAFRNREVEKTYWACVREIPDPPEGVLIDLLARNRKSNKSYVSRDSSGKVEVKKAELAYRMLARSEHYSLLEIKPHTGRHHQIRVQLSSRGWPIKGDVKYGFLRGNGDGSIHLHARKLRLMHPVKKEWIEFTADPPNDPLWSEFLGMVAND